jgi:hypothetical protein
MRLKRFLCWLLGHRYDYSVGVSWVTIEHTCGRCQHRWLERFYAG